jgi:ATP-binding cassette subfamily F protein uup
MPGQVANRPVAPAPPASLAARKDQPRRLSYNEQRELAQLPARIEALETDLAALHATMADAAFYQQPGETIAATTVRAKSLEADLAAAYARWEELESP